MFAQNCEYTLKTAIGVSLSKDRRGIAAARSRGKAQFMLVARTSLTMLSLSCLADVSFHGARHTMVSSVGMPE